MFSIFILDNTEYSTFLILLLGTQIYLLKTVLGAVIVQFQHSTYEIYRLDIN